MGTADLAGSGFLLLFRMFHFTLNLEPGLQPRKPCFRTTEENLLHGLLLFCKNRKLKAILTAACGAAAGHQWSEGLLKTYWAPWLPLPMSGVWSASAIANKTAPGFCQLCKSAAPVWQKPKRQVRTASLSNSLPAPEQTPQSNVREQVFYRDGT